MDDYCDIDAVLAKSAALDDNVTKASNPVSCWLINPGKANTFTLVENIQTARRVTITPVSSTCTAMTRSRRSGCCRPIWP